jgi:hypothetical protein
VQGVRVLSHDAFAHDELANEGALARSNPNRSPYWGHTRSLFDQFDTDPVVFGRDFIAVHVQPLAVLASILHHD